MPSRSYTFPDGTVLSGVDDYAIIPTAASSGHPTGFRDSGAAIEGIINLNDSGLTTTKFFSMSDVWTNRTTYPWIQHAESSFDYFGESDANSNLTLINLGFVGVGAGGGGADQAELDSANSLITTLRGNLNTANSQRDSANTLIVSLRDDLDSANAELGSVSTGPVQRWVT